MAAHAQTHIRIGELARRVGATPRTVRYYEELGLLPGRGAGTAATGSTTPPTRPGSPS